MISIEKLVPGKFYSSGDSIVKVHKIHKNNEIDITIYYPGGSAYSQCMPLKSLRELIPMDSHLVEVLFA